MKYIVGAMLGTLALAAAAGAAIRTQEVQYSQGATKLQGLVVWDDANTGKRPGIVVFPEWWGLTEFPKHRAQMLAQLGYVAFVADLYGNGQATQDPKEAGALAGALKKDRATLRARATAALDELKKQPTVDGEQVAAIGFCFGGTTAIELARSGAPLVGLVAFHAGLDSPTPADGKNIKGRVLVLQGADDKFITPQDYAAFENEMRENHVDWQINFYGGAVHAFTNPEADKHGIPGIAYNANADHRSWQAMQLFFNDLFKTQQPTRG